MRTFTPASAKRFSMLTSLLLFGAAVTMASPCPAQTSDAMLAQSLFEEGRELMRAGDYDAACPKLAESQRLDPGVGTLLNLGVCYEKAGKIASAWLTFKDARAAARRANDEKRIAFASSKIAALEPHLSFVLVQMQASSVPAGTTVQLDGHVLPAAVWGTKVPVDPGRHTVKVEAPGKRPWIENVHVARDADVQKVVVPEAASDGAGSDSSSDIGGGKSSAGSGAGLGYVVGGAGGLSLGIGAYFGWKALSTWDDRNEHCPSDKCDSTGKQLESDANTQAMVSNIGFGLGLVGLGLGTYLVLTASPQAPDETEQTSSVQLVPTIGVRGEGSGLVISGRW